MGAGLGRVGAPPRCRTTCWSAAPPPHRGCGSGVVGDGSGVGRVGVGLGVMGGWGSYLDAIRRAGLQPFHLVAQRPARHIHLPRLVRPAGRPVQQQGIAGERPVGGAGCHPRHHQGVGRQHVRLDGARHPWGWRTEGRGVRLVVLRLSLLPGSKLRCT